MSFPEQLHSALAKMDGAVGAAGQLMHRFRAEVDFARRLAEHRADKTAEWQALILKAVESVGAGVCGAADLEAVVAEAEALMAPIGEAAKEYTIYCAGHAHIDMNWLWPWQETVSVSHDTFATVDKLMAEFPEFHFSQSQASTYVAMEEYCPEIFEKIKERIAEGRWDITASMWVEGDKNIASGEILCRHLLYTRRYFKEKFGLPYDTVKIDWECDTFGHAHTLPSILARGGVKRYYFMRAGQEPMLFWWQAPDGSRVMAFQDRMGYNGQIGPEMANELFSFEKQNGLKSYLYIYGVGDHGGGPTRRDLGKAIEMAQWPIWPVVKLGTTDDFFTAAEKADAKLPVIDGELNFVFPGCYTSQSNVKRGNRQSENTMPEAEAVALIAAAVAGMPYPADEIRRGWRHAMFNQFHDILPGSGIHATYEYAQGLYQEIQAISGAIRTRGLRKLAAKVNTAAVAGPAPSSTSIGSTIGEGIGAGAGDPGIPGGISARNAGAVGAEPVLVFNQMPFARSEVVLAKVWNKDLQDNHVQVKDDAGNITAGQVVGRGNYWGHNFVTVAFPAKDVPGIGYRVFGIDRAVQPIPASGAWIAGGNAGETHGGSTHSPSFDANTVLENEFLRVEIEPASGAIMHLIDKASGYDLVPDGQRFGLLELHQEVPHGMTAWAIGQIKKKTLFTDEGASEVTQRGPHRVAARCSRKYNDSRIAVEIALTAGSPQVEFSVSLDWVERGTPETGVPMLRASFPVRVSDAKATYEIPFGSIERPTNAEEVPALKWADLSGKAEGAEGSFGITLVNADKYGHHASGSTLGLTLLRSSYDPDPLPEMGHHEIRFAVIPHKGIGDPSQAIRAGAAFNSPLSPVSAEVHDGELPATFGFVETLTPNAMVASIKKAEDSDALIVRVFETEGKAVEARVRISKLVQPGAAAVETDLLEQPLTRSSAKMEGDTLVVSLPAHGIATVKVG